MKQQQQRITTLAKTFGVLISENYFKAYMLSFVKGQLLIVTFD